VKATWEISSGDEPERGAAQSWVNSVMTLHSYYHIAIESGWIQQQRLTPFGTLAEGNVEALKRDLARAVTRQTEIMRWNETSKYRTDETMRKSGTECFSA